MSNRQVFPSSLFPLRGDLSAEAGAVSVKVIGIQGTSVSNVGPTNNQVLVFNSVTNQYTPSSTTNTQANQSIQVNGIVMSDDYSVSVNAVLGIAKSPMFVNGA